MTETIVKIILSLSIFVFTTRAVALKSQVSEQHTNSLEEPNYDQRSDVNNRVLDNFDHRYPDGSYEFRYELADGQARYERGYFIQLNKHKSLVVVGYYSYRMPDGRYLTVFYNADQYGYRQNQAITRETLPDLPRTIEIPETREFQTQDGDATTKTTVTDQAPTTTRRSRL